MSIWSEQAKKELNQRYSKKQAPIYLSKELSDSENTRMHLNHKSGSMTIFSMSFSDYDNMVKMRRNKN